MSSAKQFKPEPSKTIPNRWCVYDRQRNDVATREDGRPAVFVTRGEARRWADRMNGRNTQERKQHHA